MTWAAVEGPLQAGSQGQLGARPPVCRCQPKSLAKVVCASSRGVTSRAPIVLTAELREGTAHLENALPAGLQKGKESCPCCRTAPPYCQSRAAWSTGKALCRSKLCIVSLASKRRGKGQRLVLNRNELPAHKTVCLMVAGSFFFFYDPLCCNPSFRKPRCCGFSRKLSRTQNEIRKSAQKIFDLAALSSAGGTNNQQAHIREVAALDS